MAPEHRADQPSVRQPTRGHRVDIVPRGGGFVVTVDGDRKRECTGMNAVVALVNAVICNLPEPSVQEPTSDGADMADMSNEPAES